MVSGVNHITISVSDIRRSFDFYTRVLGFRPIARWSVGAYLVTGGVWIALVQETDVPRPRAQEYTHIAFTVPIDAFADARKQIMDAGAPEWKNNTSEGDSLYFLDPDGHRLEIHVSDLAARLAYMRVHPWEEITYFDQ